VSPMRCVIFGATGYLGARLVPELVSAGHDVRVMARHPAKLDDVPWRDRVEVFDGDVTDREAVRRALAGQDVLYYLVHSLMRPDFVEFDARAAAIAAAAAADAQLSRIVYAMWAALFPPSRSCPIISHRAPKWAGCYGRRVYRPWSCARRRSSGPVRPASR